MNNQQHPIQLRFYITREELSDTSKVSIQSPTQHVTRTPNNIEYNVNVFPNGRTPAEIGRFLVFLQFKFPVNVRIYANYSFNVGGIMQRAFQHSYKSSSSFGGILCPRQLLFFPQSMLENDRLRIELFGHVFIQKHSVNPWQQLTSRPNLNQASSTSSPMSKESPSFRITHTPKERKSLVEAPKTETEINVARILQQHLEEEGRASKIAETSKKAETVVVTLEEDAQKVSSNDVENVTPANTEIPEETVESKVIVEEDKKENSEMPSDVREPPPQSPERRPNSETNESDSQPTDSSSSATTEEPNQNKRLRTRTSRYVEFVVEEDDMEEPVSKKSRKRNSGFNASATDENDEYVPPRRSRSVAQTTYNDENDEISDDHPKVEYDCKIEGVEKTFEVNKEILSKKSEGFKTLFESSDESYFELEGIPDRTLEAAFTFCHGLPLKDLNNKECFSLLYFAHAFEMPELKSILEERLFEKIALTNACDIANAAIMSKSEKLRNNCKKYFIENIRNNATLRNFVALNKEFKAEVFAAVAQLPQNE